MVNPISNPFYLMPPLAAFGASLILIALVLRGTRRSFSDWLFCGLLLGLGLWGLLLFGMRSSPDLDHALIWDRGLPAAFYLTFVLYYHFTLTYTNTSGQRRILLVSYLSLAVILALTPTDLMVERMRMEYYGYAPIIGPALVPVSIGGVLLMGGAAYNLVKRYNASPWYEERNRLLYLMVALLFPLTGAFLDAFTNLPPAAIWTNLIFCIICSIAILKYHLLDIRVVVRKSLVYLLVSSGIAIPYVSLLYLLHYIFKPAMGPWWIHALIILLLAIILRPLYSSAQQFVDRLFYRDRYDALRALEQFSREAQSVVNLKELSSTMTQLVSGALRTSSVCLLLPSEGKGGFVVESCTGLESPPSGVVLRDSSPVVKWLELHKDILSSEQFDVIPQLQTFLLKEKNNLERMGAKLLVPIKTRQGQLSGILLLGQKLSQQPYSEEDKQLLMAVSNQMAMALENARLYEQTRESEEALRESEEFSSSLLSNSPYPILVINPDTSVRYVNPAMEQLTGFSSAEVIGCKAPYPWWTEETLQKTGRDLKEAMRQGAKRLEELFQKKDGERFWVEITSKPVMQNEEFMYYLSSWIDITQRKQAEEALKVYKNMVESAHDAIFFKNLGSQYIVVNDKALQAFGLPREEVIGKNDYEIMPDQEEAKKNIKDDQLVFKTGRYTEITKRMTSTDGKEYWFEAVKVPQFDDKGNITGLIGVARDITQRKQVEEALRQSEEKLRLMFEALPDGITIIDIDGKIVQSNKATAYIYGYDNKEEIIGLSIFEFIAKKDLTRITEIMKKTLNEGPLGAIELTQLRKDRSEFPAEVHGTALKDASGNPIGFITITEDITERKLAEEREKKLQQELYLSSRLASIGELAAGVAHEINNPLTGVLGFSQRLLRKSTDQEVSQGLEIIHSEALRAAKVVENLLTFARRRKPQKEYSDINDILQKALELRAYELETSNIEVVTDFAPSLPKTVVDFQQIEEVFLNIIVNAEQVMTEANRGEKLTIKTHEITGNIRVSFTDNGPGIAPEHLDKLFDPFFTTREEGGGTGLGLSICHGIVVEHGGRIYARSKPGKGATFVVELPAITEEVDRSKIVEE